MRRRWVAVAAALVGVLGSPLLRVQAAANDYSNPDYVSFDADNMARTTGRQRYQATTPDYWVASAQTFPETWATGMQRQARDLPEGRLYAGVGQILPGGNVGDPERYHEGDRILVEFLNREGTRLVGNVWPCTDP